MATTQHSTDDLFRDNIRDNILWTDEACLTREGMSNVHNSHLWARDNPRGVRERGY
jgi:hypothetical protein